MNGNFPNEEKKRIFRERAKALARSLEKGDAQRASIEVVAFTLSDELYAVESLHVREVLPLKGWTSLPSAPSHVLGIINIRGQIVSILDLRVLFQLPHRELTRSTRVVVLQSREMEMGILADAVVDARSVFLDQVHDPPPTLTGARKAYLRGVAGRDLVMLDAARLLGDKSLVVNEEVEM